MPANEAVKVLILAAFGPKTQPTLRAKDRQGHQGKYKRGHDPGRDWQITRAKHLQQSKAGKPINEAEQQHTQTTKQRPAGAHKDTHGADRKQPAEVVEQVG